MVSNIKPENVWSPLVPLQTSIIVASPENSNHDDSIELLYDYFDYSSSLYFSNFIETKDAKLALQSCGGLLLWYYFIATAALGTEPLLGTDKWIGRRIELKFVRKN